MNYEGYRKWNRCPVQKSAPSEPVPKYATWLKEKVPDDVVHIKKHKGLWHVLKGMRIIARQPGRQKDQNFHFDFKVFLRFAKSISDLYKKKRKRRRNFAFDKQMQFFTAYWYGLKREQGSNEQTKVDNDEYAFYQLMCRIESSTARSWKDTGDNAEEWDDDTEAELNKRARIEADIEFMLNEDL